MRIFFILLAIWLMPALVLPNGGDGYLWSVAEADDDDDDDDGDDDDDDDDDRGGSRGGGGGGGRDSGGRDNGPGLFNFFGGDSGADRDFIDREIIGVGLNALDIAALEIVGFSSAGNFSLPALGTSVSRLSVPSGLDMDEALDLARTTRPGVRFDFNHLYTSGGGRCLGEQCWSARLVGLESASGSACTEGGRIAIIDTAVDTGHPVLRGASVVTRSFRPDDSTAADADHGTAIAALLVGQAPAEMPTLAPGAQLLAAEVFYLYKDKVRTDALAILRAMDWAIDAQAQVIAFSLSGTANEVLENGIKEAVKRVNLVAAAGNGGPRSDPAYPAAYAEVLAVTAIDARKRLYRSANRGAYVELAAPGVDVWSADAKNGFTTWTGTSFAVPFAAAALLHTRARPGTGPGEARSLLNRSAEDLGAAGRDDVFGWGLLRVPEGRC
ncbi:S8 family serine peptidase [Pelagibius litoralis]|uniref:S8 family serine peptidase n=1 Tax=Pelagibius litoralis TaxID=374515 RepID=A0A967F3X4_9PROT|nr:S8 family serine peptidase [Pelagibius litoralis]NIA72415.1 S8 family serine peptidase [Pelagibius litoralis]